MSEINRPAGKGQMFFSLFILGMLLLIFYFFVKYVYQELRSLDSDIAVAIIAAAATIGVSVISIVLAKVYESRQVVQKEIRENKIPVYEELLGFMSRLLHGEKIGKKPTDDEMLSFFIGFNQKIMVWGSDSVLSSWRNFRESATNSIHIRSSPIEMMHRYEDMILAIRKDLGHKNEGFKRGDILRLFINDYDSMNDAKK